MSRSPYEVDQLVPQGLNGSAGKVYQLTQTSVHPTRAIGRDEIGRVIEDTVPTVYWKFMVHPKGSIDKVPMRTCSVFSMEPEAERYETMITRQAIAAGWIPLELCPYSTEWTHITHGPFVRIPDGESACAGSPGGCVHMHRVIAARKVWAKTIHDADQAAVYSLKNEDAKKLAEQISEGVGAALARHVDNLTASRAKLRSGKGEE